MSWAVILGLSAVSYALKAAGPVLTGGRQVGPRLRRRLDLVAVPLLAALILTQTLGTGHRLVFDARAPAQAEPRGAVRAALGGHRRGIAGEGRGDVAETKRDVVVT